MAATGGDGDIYRPYGVNLDAEGNLYIADTSNNRIRFIPRTSGTYWGQTMTANFIYTIAGNGTDGYGDDDVSATGGDGDLYEPSGVSLDAGGNLYIADTSNHRIRVS